MRATTAPPGYELLLLLLPPPTPLPPLEPKPPLEPPTPLDPLDPELDETPALPREPAAVLPALRLAVEDDDAEDGATLEVLLPAEDTATWPAVEADLAVAALTRAVASAADLFVAATPPPVPEPWPETDVRAASRAVLRDAACDEATVDGVDPLGPGGAE